MAGPDFETDGGSEFVPSLEKNVREQQVVSRVAPSKSSCKVQAFRVNPATE